MLPVAVARSPSTAICYTLCTSGFVDEVDFQTVGMVHGSCVFVVSGESVTASQISDQILLDEKSQQLRIAGCAPGGAKSAIYDFLVYKLLGYRAGASNSPLWVGDQPPSHIRHTKAHFTFSYNYLMIQAQQIS